MPSNEKEDQLSDTSKNTKIEQGIGLDIQNKIEEGKFSSLSYLKMGNTLLSGTGIKLNGKKILVELDLSEEKELELEIDYKMKSGKCSLVLIDGDGEESVIESDITEGKKTITLNDGKNILILNGKEASLRSGFAWLDVCNRKPRAELLQKVMWKINNHLIKFQKYIIVM